MQVLIEACVDAIDSALDAEAGGAGRIELCGELLQGGVTPSAGLISAVWERVNVPLFVLIRPRPGDFIYSEDELDVMLRDIASVRSRHVDGVVFGALTPTGDIDLGTVSRLVDAAGTMAVTFHRAFDQVRDQEVGLEALIELGVDRVLTSGAAPSALQGVDQLGRLVQQARGEIGILAGGRIDASNAAEIVRRSGVSELHLRAAVRRESGMSFRRAGPSLMRAPEGLELDRLVTDADEMRKVVDAASAT